MANYNDNGYSSRYQQKIEFSGIDNTTPKFQMDAKHAIDEVNFIPKNKALQKRFGTYDYITNFADFIFNDDFKVSANAPIYDIWTLDDYIIFHKGCGLFYIKNRTTNIQVLTRHGSASPYKVPCNKIYGIVSNHKLWILTGEKFIKIFYRDDINNLDLLNVEEDAYLPKTTMGIGYLYADSSTSLTQYEDVNLLFKWRKNGLVSGTGNFMEGAPTAIIYKDLNGNATPPTYKYKKFLYCLDGPIFSKDKSDYNKIKITITYQVRDNLNWNAAKSINPDDQQSINDQINTIFGLYGYEYNNVGTKVNAKNLRFVNYKENCEAQSDISNYGIYKSVYEAGMDFVHEVSYPYVKTETTNSSDDGRMRQTPISKANTAIGGLHPSGYDPSIHTPSTTDIADSKQKYLAHFFTWGYSSAINLPNPTNTFELYGNDWNTWPINPLCRPVGLSPRSEAEIVEKMSLLGKYNYYLHFGSSDKATETKSGLDAALNRLTDELKDKLGQNFGTKIINLFVKDQKIYADSECTSLSQVGQLNNVDNPKMNGQVELWLTQDKNDDGLWYKSAIQGDSNIEITFPCEVGNNADKINHCTFGKLFGVKRSVDRLFVSGNSEYPNYDWHTSPKLALGVNDTNNDFDYFGDTSWASYGSEQSAIVGYDMLSDGKLLVLKETSSIDPSIYYRTANTTTNTLLVSQPVGEEQQSVYQGELKKESFEKYITTSHQGGKSWFSIANYNGDTVYVSDDNKLLGLDIKGITNDNTRVASDRTALISLDLKDALDPYIFLSKDSLYYSTNKALYYTNIEQPYEWFKLDVGGQVISHVRNTNIELFGTNNGHILAFDENDYHDYRTYQRTSGFNFKENSDNKIVCFDGNVYDEFKKCKYAIIRDGTNKPALLRISDYKTERTNTININPTQMGVVGHLPMATIDDDYEFTLSNLDEKDIKELTRLWNVNDLSAYTTSVEDIKSFTKIDSIILIKYQPVCAYYITAPFTAGTLQYRKSILSYTYYNDLGADNDIHLSSFTERDTLDKCINNQTLVNTYNFTNIDYENTNYQKNSYPTTFTCYIPMVCDFWCGCIESQEPKNAYLTGMEISYIITNPAYAGSLTQF